jgi:hypothetical protein
MKMREVQLGRLRRCTMVVVMKIVAQLQTEEEEEEDGSDLSS